MTILMALVLGIVQGLTEFLPVSSSGHLVLLQNWFGIQEPPVHFDVMLHVATLMAVVWMFRKRIDVILIDAGRECRAIIKKEQPFSWNPRGALRYVLLLLIGTVVTGVIGLTFEDWFESMFSNSVGVGFALILTGAVLLFTLRAPKEGPVLSTDQMPLWHALVIGAAQGMAVMPGLSRSGTTIAVALLLGLNRSLAVQFSFLLCIPAILGVAAKEVCSCRNPMPTNVLLVGMLAAFGAGYACLAVLRFFVRRGRLHWFAFYCIPLGLVVLFFSWLA